MGKHTGKIPVSEPIVAKAMDRQPFEKLGDKWAQGLSEKQMQKYAQRNDMAAVWQTIQDKAVIKDLTNGEEINPQDMKDSVPYVIQPQNKDINIGWVMRKGSAGVGRIYNSKIDAYDAIKNDPDRPSALRDVDFEGWDESDMDMGIDDTPDEDFDDDYDMD